MFAFISVTDEGEEINAADADGVNGHNRTGALIWTDDRADRREFDNIPFDRSRRFVNGDFGSSVYVEKRYY